MPLSALGLNHAPFRTEGEPHTHVSYEGERAALAFLSDAVARDSALALFQGPPRSGKTTILEAFGRSLGEHTAFARADGGGAETRTLFEEVLGRFGYEFEYSSVNELVNMLRVFVLQQAGSGRPPVLVVENVHAMLPAALDRLCELMALRVRHASALRLVFASDRSLEPMMRAPAMAAAVASREVLSFHLEPMSGFETRQYVYAKLKAAGCREPAQVFPEDVCLELHEAAGGWPGWVDRLAQLALGRATKLPLTADLIERSETLDNLPALVDAAIDWTADAPEPPKLIVTRDGETLEELVMQGPRFLIGRAEHNDLRINSRFVSRHHVLLVRHGTATFLMDLNSTNGTFVNSRRVSNLMLRHEDIVQLGHYRIKFLDPQATGRAAPDDASFSETVVMQSFEDVRRLLARQRAEAAALARRA